MDIYLTAFALGAIGLVAMAVGGFSRDGHGSHGHSHGGHDAHIGHGGHVGHDAHAGHADHGAGHSIAAKSAGNDFHSHDMSDGPWSTILSLMSPRVLFSVALGFGAVGLLFRGTLGGPLLFALALAGGFLFDRVIVSPLWNLIFRFASTPALSLESCLTDQATAVTNFNSRGEGLIAVEVDGQNVQLLGTLQVQDREMGVRVRAGNQLRIEEVDAARNRCTVSLL